jgi:hypothetical protein
MSSIAVEARFKEKLFKVFKDSPEIIALLEVISDPMQDTVDAIDFLLGSLSIDDREGEQLDYLGTRLGVERPNEQEPYENIFCLNGDLTLGSQGFSDENYPSEGGYFADEKGLPLQSNPDQKMSDEGYRRLLKQKASAFRTLATRENLFTYLIDFGSRALINDDTGHHIQFDLIDHYSLNEFEKWYLLTRGFKPAGISTEVRENIRDGEEI